MKYVVSGSLGHISKRIAFALVKAGHEVTVITSNHDRVKEIQSLGAKAAAGSLEDAAFLKKTFAGAQAVYTMVPPPARPVNDWKAFIAQIGKNYAEAIRENNIPHVVNLSSIGAHLGGGCGPVDGISRVENILNELGDTNIKHLRPAFFYYNLLNMIPLAKNMGIIGNNFSTKTSPLPLVDPSDIAAAAVDELLTLKFTGHSVVYIASQEATTDEIAAVLGKAIGKPELKWVQFTDEQALQGALQAGVPEELAKNLVEMGQCMESGKMNEDYWKHRPAIMGKVTLTDFAKTFAEAYNNGSPVPAH